MNDSKELNAAPPSAIQIIQRRQAIYKLKTVRNGGVESA